MFYHLMILFYVVGGLGYTSLYFQLIDRNRNIGSYFNVPTKPFKTFAYWGNFVEVDYKDYLKVIEGCNEVSYEDIMKTHHTKLSQVSRLKSASTLKESACWVMDGKARDEINGVCNINKTHGAAISYLITSTITNLDNQVRGAYTFGLLEAPKVDIKDNGDFLILGNLASANVGSIPTMSWASWYEQKGIKNPVIRAMIPGSRENAVRLCRSDQVDSSFDYICDAGVRQTEERNIEFDPAIRPVLVTNTGEKRIVEPYLIKNAYYNKIQGPTESYDNSQLTGVEGDKVIGNPTDITSIPISSGSTVFVIIIQGLALIFGSLYVSIKTEGITWFTGHSMKVVQCMNYEIARMSSFLVLAAQLMVWFYNESFFIVLNNASSDSSFSNKFFTITQHSCVMAFAMTMYGFIYKMTLSAWLSPWSFKAYLVLLCFYIVTVLYFTLTDSVSSPIDKAGFDMQTRSSCIPGSEFCGEFIPTYIHYSVLAVVCPGFLLCAVERILGPRSFNPLQKNNSKTSVVVKSSTYGGKTTGFEKVCIGINLQRLVRDKSDTDLFRGDGKERRVHEDIFSCLGFVNIHNEFIVRNKDFLIVVLERKIPEFILRRFTLSYVYWRIDPKTGKIARGERRMMQAVDSNGKNIVFPKVALGPSM